MNAWTVFKIARNKWRLPSLLSVYYIRLLLAAKSFEGQDERFFVRQQREGMLIDLQTETHRVSEQRNILHLAMSERP